MTQKNQKSIVIRVDKVVYTKLLVINYYAAKLKKQFGEAGRINFADVSVDKYVENFLDFIDFKQTTPLKQALEAISDHPEFQFQGTCPNCGNIHRENTEYSEYYNEKTICIKIRSDVFAKILAFYTKPHFKDFHKIFTRIEQGIDSNLWNKIFTNDGYRGLSKQLDFNKLEDQIHPQIAISPKQEFYGLCTKCGYSDYPEINMIIVNELSTKKSEIA